MKAAKAAEMREIDRIAIEQFGIPGILLMEHAAMSVAEVCRNRLKKCKENKVLFLCGKGNNGGDAFAVARMLYQEGYEVGILFLSNPEQVSGDALINLKILQAMSCPICCDLEQANHMINHSQIIVDGVFGTGLKGEVYRPVSDIFKLVNESGKYVVSIDIPSGVSSDTGQILGSAVRADETVTFELPKRGHYLYPGKEYVGKLHIVDIGIPEQIMKEKPILCAVLTETEAAMILPKRERRSNKGNYGRLFVVAGSNSMTGAAVLACKGAYRCGAGIVYACVVKSAVRVLQTLIPSAVEIPLAEKEGQLCVASLEELLVKLPQAKAVVLGCGLGQGKEVKKFVIQLLHHVNVPIVLDADGLNAVAEHCDILKSIKAPVIVTPHPGEMSRLTGKTVKEILDNTIETAAQFAKEYGVITVLKDAATIIAHPDGRIFINTTGNPAMAKGGSGDVLSGVIGGFLAQGCEPFQASVLGVFVHGKAGDTATQKWGQYGLTAEELADFVPQAINHFVLD